MRSKSRYLVVSESELQLASELLQPVRAHQNILAYTFLTNARVFVEVTDSVKFKRDSLGRPKFVSTKLSLVPTKHPKSNEDRRVAARHRTTRRKAS